MQDYGYHQVINPDRFFTDNWDFLTEALYPPRLEHPIAKDGNKSIATAILNLL
jgi:hypothetical protein